MALLLAVTAVSAIVVRAQSPRPMSIVDLLSLPRLTEPQLSPDGRDIVFTRSDADWKTGRRVSHVWRARVEGGEPAQLTHGAENETGPRWSPDGRTIAFIAKRGDNEFAQIYLLAVDGGEARQLTTHGSAVSDVTWAPDGSSLYFIAPEPKTADDKTRERLRDDVYAFEENYKQTHLWKVSVSSKAEERITSGDFSVTGYHLSDGGRKIAYHRAPTPLLGSGDEGEVWAANADGSSAVRLTTNTVGETARQNIAGRLAGAVHLGVEREIRHLLQRPSVRGARVRRTARVLVGETEPYDVDQAMWSSDGKSIYFLANLGVHEEVFQVPAAGGKPRQLTDGKHNIGQLVAVTRSVGLHTERLDGRRHLDDENRRRGAVASHTRSSRGSRATSSSDARKRFSGKAPTARPSRGWSPIRSTISRGRSIRWPS